MKSPFYNAGLNIDFLLSYRNIIIDFNKYMVFIILSINTLI